MTKQRPAKFSEAIEDNESLLILMRQLAKLERMFCDYMHTGNDFTLRLEVRGNRGVLLHARVNGDDIERPNGAQQRIDEKTEAA